MSEAPRRIPPIAGGAIVVLVLLLVGGAIAHQVTAANALSVPGGVTVTGPGSELEPLVAGVAGLDNSGPWPITILSVEASIDVGVSLTLLENDGGGQTIEPGELSPNGPRLEIPAGGSGYLWLALTPDGNSPAVVEYVDVTYSGPFGLQYTKRVDSFSLLAFPAELPSGVAALTGDEASVGDYLDALRAALLSGDQAVLRTVTGLDDPTAFAESQRDVAENMGYTYNDSTVSFFTQNSATDGLPPFEVAFENYRWRVLPQ